VGSHARGEKGRRSVIAQPVTGRFRDRREVVDAAAAGGDGDISLRGLDAQRIQLSMHFLRHLSEWMGDEALMNAMNEHGKEWETLGYPSVIRRVRREQCRRKEFDGFPL